MALTDIQVRNAKPTDKPYKLTDSGGLFLLVKPSAKDKSGGKLWRYKFRFDKKEQLLSFGSYPAVSLLDARIKHGKAKALLEAGINPAAAKQEAKKADQQAEPVEAAPQPVAVDPERTFRACARRWHANRKVRWKDDYALRIWTRLMDDVFPAIGEMDIAAIESPDVLKLIQAVEGRGAYDLARRHRQNISGVFRFAIASGLCKHDPAAPIQEAMAAKPATINRAFIPESELPVFFAKLALSGMDESTALGLKFIIHTALRTNELRLGRWEELTDDDSWLVPAERMKMGKPHRVVLTPQVKAILKRLKELAGDSPWILPGEDAHLKPISGNTLLFALYNCGYRSTATVHGFRVTFSTAANNSGLFRSDVIELAIAHTDGSSVRGVYNKAQNWPERVALAEWWSDRVSGYEAQGLARAEKAKRLEGLI